MKAAILFEAQKPVTVDTVDIGEPGPGEVLVKIMASGVCHSDWHVAKGDWDNVPLPAILGHEGAGIGEAVGPNARGVRQGDHVVLSWKTNCGICEMCERGYPNLCERSPRPSTKPKTNGTELHPMAGVGTMAEYSIVPDVAAVPIDKDIPFPQAALVGCGVTTGVGAAINTAQVQPGTTVAVFGCGGVGLNVIQGARIAGATTIIAIDLLDNKLAMSEEFGATHKINASKEDVVPRIKELTDRKGVHYAFEAIGLVEKPFVQSVHCTRYRGISIWVGHAPLRTPVTIDARDLIMEKTIMASMYGTARPHIEFNKMLGLYKTGNLKLDELITRRYSLQDINTAFEALAKGEVARSVLDIG